MAKTLLLGNGVFHGLKNSRKFPDGLSEKLSFVIISRTINLT
jgi:hypothetical protein